VEARNLNTETLKICIKYMYMPEYIGKWKVNILIDTCPTSQIAGPELAHGIH
jgi:hypothetical protein